MLKLTTLVIATATSQEPEWDYEDAKQPENDDIPHEHEHPYTHNEAEGYGGKHKPLERGVAHLAAQIRHDLITRKENDERLEINIVIGEYIDETRPRAEELEADY
jgi:hypothetical protein